MTILKESVHIPATIEHRQKAIACDLCGKTSPAPNNWVKRGNFDVNEVTIEHRQGTNYGHDGGNIKEHKVDICPDCFHGKLVPWLAEHGAKLRTEERDW